MSTSSRPSVPTHIESLFPYVPGKPIEETAREYNLKKVVKLASNENPLGPSTLAIEAVKKMMHDQHRYPDASYSALKKVISEKFKLTEDQLLIGNGSNELIELFIRTFCFPGDAVLTSKGAFIAYRISAQIHGTRVIETEMKSELRFDLDAMLKALVEDKSNGEKIKLIFIANPNNPTGAYIPKSELVPFLESVKKLRGNNVVVVLDDAYSEYVTAPDFPDALSLYRTFENVAVFKTFSKVYGLAGFRVGFGVARKDILSPVQKVRMPFNVSEIGVIAAAAALSDEKFIKASFEINQKGMKFWEDFFKKNNIPYIKSQANFLLIDTQKGFGKSGKEIFDLSLKEGVIFRPVANYALNDYLRVSIGTETENEFAAQVLTKILAKK